MKFQSIIKRGLCIFYISLCVHPFAISAQVQQQQPEKDPTQEAVDFLRLIGAIITTDDQGRAVALQFPEGIGFDQQGWHHIGHLVDLQDLDLGALYIGNDLLQHVGKLKSLKNLNLFGNPIDSIGLQHIEQLDQLETLYLYRTFVDDAGIDSIAKLPKLRRLNMFDTFLTDKGLEKLGAMTELENLSIGNSKAGQFPESFFSEAGIQGLKENLPNTAITLWGFDDRLDFPDTIQRAQSEKAKGQQRLLIEQIALAPDLSQRKGEDWPAFLGPERNGKSSETDLQMNWNTHPPKLLWHQKIGTGYAAPTIAKGRLLLYQRVPNPEGPNRFKETLSCLHSETGEEIWNADFDTRYEDLNGYGDGPRSTPVVDEDRIFLLSPEGMFRCLQLVDGKTIWELDLIRHFDCALPLYGMGASPIVYGDLVLVVVGSKEDSEQASTVVAFDKTNGVFRYGVGNFPASYSTPVLHQAAGRDWCFAFNQNGLLSFNPRDGQSDFNLPWQSNIAGTANAANPVAHDEQVFITESYKLGGAKLKFASGAAEIVWKDSLQVRDKAMACHWNTPILHEGFLYGCSGRHRSNGEIKCIRWDNGQTAWRIKLDGRSSLTFADKHFVNLSESGLVTCFQATSTGYVETGRLEKGKEGIVLPSYPAWSAPVIAKGLMYLRGKHELICYDLRAEEGK